MKNSSPRPQRNGDEENSLSRWLDRMKDGDELAAEELWRRYFEKLVRLIAPRLGRITARIDGDDVAGSVLGSVLMGMRDGRFSSLRSDGLWPLLVTYARRKAINGVRREEAIKRRASDTHSMEDLELEQIISEEPTPEMATIIMDLLDELVAKTSDPKLRTIAIMRLEQYTIDEIASEVGVVDRTVLRKLALIRQEWDAVNDS